MSTTQSMTGLRSLLATSMLAMTMAAAAFLPGIAAADEPIEDPAALAATYDQQAAKFRSDAERHLKAARTHKAGAGSPKVSHESIARHCERIAENLMAAAEESEALAKTYRELAEK